MAGACGVAIGARHGHASPVPTVAAAAIAPNAEVHAEPPTVPSATLVAAVAKAPPAPIATAAAKPKVKRPKPAPKPLDWKESPY